MAKGQAIRDPGLVKILSIPSTLTGGAFTPDIRPNQVVSLGSTLLFPLTRLLQPRSVRLRPYGIPEIGR
jgi:hypothetical protein